MSRSRMDAVTASMSPTTRVAATRDLEACVARLGARCGFTSREREVVCRILCGDTNAEIAARLEIAHGTVKSHVEHVLDKAGARRRQDLMRLVWTDAS